MQSCSSRKLNPAEQIVQWINERKKANLGGSLHHEFRLTHRNAPLDKTRDAQYFVEEFIETQKFLEGKYKITKVEHQSGTEDGHPIDIYQVYATYNNIYQKYLGVDPHKSLMKMEFVQDKLISISMGSADKERTEEFQEVFKKFEEWMKRNHPREDLYQLMKTRDQRFVERMKEFKKDN